MSRRTSSIVKKRRAVLTARYAVRAALKSIEKAAKLYESDLDNDLVLAVRALRSIAASSRCDAVSAGIASGALRRMRLGGKS